MEQPTVRFSVLVGLVIGSITGALIRISTPDSWWNLSFMPWYAIPVAWPSLFLLFVMALILEIDVFTDAANQMLVNALLILTTAIVVGSYGAIFGRLWAGRRSAR